MNAREIAEMLKERNEELVLNPPDWGMLGKIGKIFDEATIERAVAGFPTDRLIEKPGPFLFSICKREVIKGIHKNPEAIFETGDI